jgi:hypothetical protein
MQKTYLLTKTFIQMKKFILLALLLAPTAMFSQFADNFNNGLQQWTGNVDSFKINDDTQLQLNASTGGTAYLQNSSALAENAYWEWWMKIDCNPTSGNYAAVYLASEEPDLSVKVNGLFVRIGYTDKNICLIKANKDGNNKTLIAGEKNRLSADGATLNLKATLNRKGVFNLYSKLDGEQDFTLEGTYTQSETVSGQYFGLVCTFTKTNSAKFYFDDFLVRTLRDDEQDDDDPQVEAGDILLNEILYDPPTDGDEWVELYNNSGTTIDLQQLSIATRKTDGTLNKTYSLATVATPFNAGEYLVVTKSRENICPYFNCRENVLYAELAVFPALANTGATVVILNTQTLDVIDEVSYSPDWHTAGISNKKGISLERLNFSQPSNDATNWASASSDSGFGTPGYENSNSTGGIDDISVEYPPFAADNYVIHYRLSSAGLRCNARLFDIAGRLVSTLANNRLLGTEGDIEWHSRNLDGGVYIIHLELFDAKGVAKRFTKPVVVR